MYFSFWMLCIFLAWASTSTIAAAPIAMDTSVPWVEDGEATQKGGPGWASFEQPKPEEAGGWADFGQLSSAGGEGFASFGAFGEETAVRDKQGKKVTNFKTIKIYVFR